MGLGFKALTATGEEVTGKDHTAVVEYQLIKEGKVLQSWKTPNHPDRQVKNNG